MPTKLEKGAVVDAKISLENGKESHRYYKATIRRMRKDGTMDLEFTGISERQKKLMPGTCQPKFVDADEDSEASDLYHDKFHKKEHSFQKKKGKSRRIGEADVKSILKLFKEIESRQKDMDEKKEDFDEAIGSDNTRGNMEGYHRL